MKAILHILAIFLLPALVYGQEILVFRGQVTDAATNEPLADSHIYVSCQKYGAISDENGYFELEVPRCYMTQCIVISYMGYDRYIAPIHNILDNQLNIELEHGVMELAELVITPDHYLIIHKPVFEPFQPDYRETIHADSELIEDLLYNTAERLISMF